MPETETIDTSFRIKYIPHKTRSENNLSSFLFLVVLFTGYLIYKALEIHSYRWALLIFVMSASLSLLYCYREYYLNPLPFINEIRITNHQVIITGYNYDTVWEKHLNIPETQLKIVGAGRARSTNIDYHLVFTSNEKLFRINNNQKWNYFDIHEMFTLFYKIKNEIPRLEDRLMIDYIEKKAHGISSFDMIYRHKKIER